MSPPVSTTEPCGDRQRTKSQRIHPQALSSLSTSDLQNLLVRYRYPALSIKTIQSMSREAMCEMVLKHAIVPHRSIRIRTLQLPSYNNNSCYMDSTLVALFHRKENRWLKHKLFGKSLQKINEGRVPPPALVAATHRVRTALRHVWDSMHAKHSGKNSSMDQNRLFCSTVREAFKNYDRVYGSRSEHIDWLHSQQEPLDVLNALQSIFQIRDAIKIERKMIHRGKKTLSTNHVTLPHHVIVSSGDLMDAMQQHRKLALRDWIPKRRERISETLVKQETIVQPPPMLVVTLARNFMNEQKIMASVIPLDFITSLQLECVSIVIHHGSSPNTGHYTLMFKYSKNGLWYHYDDLSPTVELVGRFKDVLAWRKQMVIKNCTLCVYIRHTKSQSQ